MSKRIIQSNTPRPIPVRVMQTGSQGHGKTLAAMAAYHKAKKAGKNCLIMAKNEQEKVRLVQNHFVDPMDIRVNGNVRNN